MRDDKYSFQDIKVQVHIPYPFLIKKFDEIMREGINPEVYFDEVSLEIAVPSDLENIRDECGQRGLTLTMHGPYSDLNPGSADERVRTRTVEVYGRAFEAAGYLRPRTIVLHAGYSEKRFKGNMDIWLSQSLKTWPGFVSTAKRLNMVIAVEHIFEKTPRSLKALMAAVNSPFFGVCVDSGHLNVFAGEGMEEWIKELGPFIAEAHIHDNGGLNDDHLPVGDGSIDFHLFFRLLKTYAREPVFTIEPHGEEMMRRGISAVKRLLEEL